MYGKAFEAVQLIRKSFFSSLKALGYNSCFKLDKTLRLIY